MSSDKYAIEQAAAQFDHIRELLLAHEIDPDDQGIDEHPLSVEVRSSWYAPGSSDEQRTPEEYNILLCTGGPAVRIVGGLSDGCPVSAQMQYQDWGTPWTNWFRPGDTEDILLQYAGHFYFGE